ncbi:choice-of-anchor A family protein [Brumimicrobium glaciale]|uniref:Choice-of-anchor A family protein n=1 Tax=Brumimicrobium glaciale TaxID=200475 RepID=A0A4V1WFK2_9FLAO|nr:choice-of-anchor A family protein [Brumimicrobium glaciale]RYM33486.1 choice-of-anchor A family protein [Brumimicrobium glaciale]
MVRIYLKLNFFLSAIVILCSTLTFGQSPTHLAKGFNVFIENDMTLSTNESEGPVACGNDLILKGNYQVATNHSGNFLVNGTKIGLLVGGLVKYESGNQLYVNQNTYVKIGNSQGSNVWYYDQNNAASPIRITPSSNYNSSPRIMLQANSNQLGVGVNNNPVFEGNLVDFSNAFQKMRSISSSIAQCSGNAQLTNPNGQPIPNTNLPSQVKINLQNGINYLNVTGADMNNVQVFTYNQQPSASKVLIINVNAPGNFNWKVWNQAGVGFQNCPYILYNFYNTTNLKIQGNSTIEGTVYAPFADIEKIVNQSNIEGQVIGKSLNHKGGEMHYALFAPSITGCAPAPGVSPTSEFNTTNSSQCLNDNQFQFNNTSNTGSAVQPSAPLSYLWDFGDGTTSTDMNPSNIYASAGTYTVTLTTTNTYGSDTETLQITVHPTIDAIVTVTTTGVGTSTVTKYFTLTNSNQFSNFLWELSSIGSGLFVNQSNVSFDFTQAGYYEVIVTTIDNNGCENTNMIPVVIASDEVSTGNNGGLESESLGDAVSKQYANRKMKSIPTIFDKQSALKYNKIELLSNATKGGGNSQTLLEMFPTELEVGDNAYISSPTDILDYTTAEEVLSVDFSINEKTRGVVLGIKTIDKVYNHTKASCDRLNGAEILNVNTVQIEGYNFLAQAIKQRNGDVEYAISFVVGKNEDQTNYSLQTNWYVNEFTKSDEVYNFQVWTTSPEETNKLVKDILNNLISNTNIDQTEIQKLPKTYAAKVSREGIDMVIKLKSTAVEQSIEISMEEVYTETGGSALRYNPFKSEREQIVSFEIKDGYEYDALIKVNGEIQDAFYHADGNWGLDFDPTFTTIEEYTVSNDFERVYEENEMAIHRNVHIKAHSEFDYLTLYKSLLPGNTPEDYSAYKFLSFTAKGSGLLELGLVKSSVENWKNQYKATINVLEEERTYYIPFDYFNSTGTMQTIKANDLTMLTFTFLPVEAETNDLDLTIEGVKFTKSAPDGYQEFLSTMSNEFIVYPNPSNGNLKCVLYSEEESDAKVTLHDITGKIVYSAPVKLTKGRNELQFDLEKPKGVLFFNITSSKTNFGTSRVMFK